MKNTLSTAHRTEALPAAMEMYQISACFLCGGFRKPRNVVWNTGLFELQSVGVIVVVVIGSDSYPSDSTVTPAPIIPVIQTLASNA